MNYWKAFISPFKPPKFKFYFGKIRVGVPYFLPRYWKDNHAVTRRFGFDSCGLGWKTKWSPIDYRHEWNPIFSFVAFGLQVAITITPEHECHYWESWLYYERNTDHKLPKRERIKLAREGFPNTWISYTPAGGKEQVCYWDLILKPRYL